MPRRWASHIPGVPDERRDEWPSGSKASVISAEPPRSLIPGLIIHGAARPQLCLCFPLILSICVWDRRGTPGHTTLSIHTAPCINEHKEEATKKKRPNSISWFCGYLTLNTVGWRLTQFLYSYLKWTLTQISQLGTVQMNNCAIH